MDQESFFKEVNTPSIQIPPWRTNTYNVHTLLLLIRMSCLSEITSCLLDLTLYIEKDLSLPVVKFDDAVKVDSRISESLLVLAFTGVHDPYEEFVFTGRGKGHVFACVG